MKLAFAQACADRIVERLYPFCDRIQVAGSIRRCRPECGDVDLVAIPKTMGETDLLGTITGTRNLAAIEVRKWAKAEGWAVEKDGPQYLVFTARGVQVDIWWATAECFGTMFVSRTGSKEHNIALAMRAMDLGGKWDPHHGLRIGGRNFAATEEEIYQALRLPFLDPLRERDLPWISNLRNR